VDHLNQFLLGAIAMSCTVITVFFVRFWRESRDRFFLIFALSFLLEGANRVAIALSAKPNEATPLLFGVRLFAYLLIIAAVADKNRTRYGR
jgi:uncharacterized membrane protein HdeD (DUF308 family)